MEKEFIPYEQALELKQLGFDELSFGWFTIEGDGAKPKFILSTKHKQDIGLCLAPLFQQAFRWFREKYNLYAWAKYEFEDDKITPTYYIISPEYADIPGGPYNTYEEAELACLNKLIEIVKTK